MKKNTFFKITMVTFFILSIFVLISCSKVTKENYDKVKVGMIYSELIDILGEPEECNSVMGAKNCTWGDEKKSISIKIISDKVVFMSAKGL